MQASYEKIKVAVSEDLLKILDRDVESFEFRKKDLSLNKNSFINTLISSYFDAFNEKEKEMTAKLNEIADKCGLRDEKKDKFIEMIVRNSYKEYQKKDNYSKAISFRPIKKNLYTIDYIENNLLAGSSLSDYFRRMFASYCSLPQYQRERILFKDIYNKVEEAIRRKKKIYVSTRFNAGNRTPISPYSFAVVKEETYNYLLGKNEDYRNFRLSKIKDVIIINEDTSFTAEDKAHFERMIKYGPQYFYSNEEEEAEIILTPKGQNLFRSFYVYRPLVDRIEGDHYFFKCSLDQLFQYFSRFGSECYVIKPQTLKRRLIKYYRNAYEQLA